jgi:hypothetical protein
MPRARARSMICAEVARICSTDSPRSPSLAAERDDQHHDVVGQQPVEPPEPPADVSPETPR